MILTLERLEDNDLSIPSYATDGSAAFDFQACLKRINKERIRIEPGEVVLVPTGFLCSFKPSLVLKLYIRSGLSIKGLQLANSVGVIDSDYRGEIMVALRNVGKHTIIITHGDRVAQGILERVDRCVIVQDKVDATTRGTGGFGSTGS